MAVVGVMIADIFTGFAATVWTAWHVFAVFLGIIIVWIFTAAYAAISPSYSVTELYGNHFLVFRAPYFWLSLPLVFILAVAPRYFFKGFTSVFNPGDLELMRMLRKKDPGRATDLRRPTYPAGDDEERPSRDQDRQDVGLVRLRNPSGVSSRMTMSRTSFNSVAPRASIDCRSASRTDMSTGMTTQDRGYNFAMEEPGAPHLRRIQTNISERRIGRGGRVHVSESDAGDPRRSRSGGKGNFGISSIARARRMSQKLKSRIGAPQRTDSTGDSP